MDDSGHMFLVIPWRKYMSRCLSVLSIVKPSRSTRLNKYIQQKLANTFVSKLARKIERTHQQPSQNSSHDDRRDSIGQLAQQLCSNTIITAQHDIAQQQHNARLLFLSPHGTQHNTRTRKGEHDNQGSPQCNNVHTDWCTMG